MTITKNLEHIQYFSFERDFVENANLFQKTGVRFLVESTKNENITFPYKTTLSEANVKTNRMDSSKWAYHKEWSFASNYFIFSKILFQFKDLVRRFDFMYQTAKFPYS